jgi:HK97 family phage prohead protease
MQHLTADVATEGDDPGTISGTACRYGVELDRGYGLLMVLEPECFASQVKDPARVLVLWQHDTDAPIGRLSQLDDHPDRLDFAGTILDSPKVPDGQRALALLREGILRQVSVGFRIQKYTRVVDEEADTVTYRILKAWLQELSMVTFGAFGDDATVDEVNSLRGMGVAVLEARRIRAELAGLLS